MKAVCMIREQPHYRRDAFVQGLQRAGYTVSFGPSPRPDSRDDLLVIWNRYGSYEHAAEAWERAGGTVLVAENGYIGKDEAGLQYYALAVHGHNGSGWFPEEDEDRFTKLNIELKPFTSRSGYYLVCGQRGIGSRTMASPNDWHVKASRHLAGLKNPPEVKVRLHPGNHAPVIPLEKDLDGAAVCVIWSSSSGVKALVEGIPVKYDAPHWICSRAATRLTSGEMLRDEGARLKALRHMAWAQWSVAELATGEPFARIRARLGEAKW